MKLLQSPNNSDDSTDHLCVHTMGLRDLVFQEAHLRLELVHLFLVELLLLAWIGPGHRTSPLAWRKYRAGPPDDRGGRGKSSDR